MRKTYLLGLLLLLGGVLPLAADNDPPELEIDPGLQVTGAPLSFKATWNQDEAETLPVEILLDGRIVGRAELASGDNEIEVAEVTIASGHRRLTLRSDSAGADTKLRVLPGWLSILPPLLAIALALISRDVLISLLLGVFGGSLILNGWDPLAAFARTLDHFILGSLADRDHAAILIFTTLLGGMVGLLSKSGGTLGIVRRLTPYATDRRRGQLATWIMGVLVFFDDYSNTLIVGPTMRPITDKLGISREKLAYIVDSTAAPVVCLFPISTWIGFELGLIHDAFAGLDLPLEPYEIFLRSIPFRFYPVFALIFGFTIAASRVDFGPMRKAELRARNGEVLAADAKPIADYATPEVEPPEGIPARARNALLPIFTVVTVTIVGLYVTGAEGLTRTADQSWIDWLRAVLGHANSFHALLWASASGILMALFLILSQRLLKVGEAMTAMVSGFKAMLMAFAVLILAWSLGSVCGELHTAEFLVSLTRGVVSPQWLPALTFVLSAAISFATGTSWGTMAILEPLVIPICHNLALGAGHEVGDERYLLYMVASIATVLAGSVWGDHCSPISDTTILSSMASGCDHIAHVRTQLPYSLSIGLLGILLGNIPTAFGLSPWLSLVLGLVVIVVGIHLLGHRHGATVAET